MERMSGVQEVMGSINVRDSEFFFVSCLCHVDQVIFHRYHSVAQMSLNLIYKLEVNILTRKWFQHCSIMPVCNSNFHFFKCVQNIKLGNHETVKTQYFFYIIHQIKTKCTCGVVNKLHSWAGDKFWVKCDFLQLHETSTSFDSIYSLAF